MLFLSTLIDVVRLWFADANGVGCADARVQFAG